MTERSPPYGIGAAGRAFALSVYRLAQALERMPPKTCPDGRSCYGFCESDGCCPGIADGERMKQGRE
jgi:hypothetical protein